MEEGGERFGKQILIPKRKEKKKGAVPPLGGEDACSER